jgi:hypothetical protein
LPDDQWPQASAQFHFSSPSSAISTSVFRGPDPLGTKAFEIAVELINKNAQRSDFVLFTGDLTHDAESRDVHAERMQLYSTASISARVIIRPVIIRSITRASILSRWTMSRAAAPKSAPTNLHGSRPASPAPGSAEVEVHDETIERFKT